MSYSYLIALVSVLGALGAGGLVAWGFSKLPAAADKRFTQFMDGGDTDQ